LSGGRTLGDTRDALDPEGGSTGRVAGGEPRGASQARLTRLRIAGFKSFAEAASVEILPGLTGIVGPNGCGKSNIVEALRWAMGESSARSLRGGEMDDLIFAGTASRPARNLAEVTLTLEEARGLAPAPFGEEAELQISRRIERGAGSFYRINGRDMRARDVQTLFADLASGARSSAMVSQGRVSAIVSARPEDRRTVLEEAAGITGLHARRHEAELKLRATEANLARAEDLRLALEARLGELGGQARQASRYREVSAALREAEDALRTLLHTRIRREAEETASLLAGGEGELLTAQAHVQEARALEAAARAGLEPAREAEAAARSTIERLRAAAEILAEEEARAGTALQAARVRLAQAHADEDAARHRLADARQALLAVEADRAAAGARAATLPGRQREAEMRLEAATGALAGATEAVAAAERRRLAAAEEGARHARALDEAGRRVHVLDAAIAELGAEIRQAQALLPDAALLARTDEDATHSLRMLEQARLAAAAASQDATEAAREEQAARAAAAEDGRLREAAARAAEAATRRAASLAGELEAAGRHLAEARAASVAPDALATSRDEIVLREAAAQAAVALLEAAEAERGRRQQEQHEARRQLDEHRSLQEQLGAEHRRALATHEALGRQHGQLAAETRAAAAALPDPAALAEAARALAASEAGAASAAAALAGAETARAEAQEQAEQAARRLAEAEAEAARLQAEHDGLGRALAPDAAGTADREAAPVAGALVVPHGLEAAVAAVLAEGLEASLDAQAPRHWRELPPCEVLPPPVAATPLATLVEAPAALARALSHAWLVEDEAQARLAQNQLAPGVCLVTRAGTVLRWDGYSATGGAAGSRAARLEQQARLREVAAALQQAGPAAARLREAADRLREARAQAEAAARGAREERDAAEQQLAGLRAANSRLAAEAATARARHDALAPQCEQAHEALQAAGAGLAEAERRLGDLPDPDALGAALAAAAASEQEARATEERAREERRLSVAALEQARGEAARLSARAGEADTRLQGWLPQQQRLQAELEEAADARQKALDALHALPAPDFAAARLAAAAERQQRALAAEAEARTALEAAEQAREQAVQARTALAAALAREESRLDGLLPRLATLQGEQARAAEELERQQRLAASLPDPGTEAAAGQAAEAALADARREEAVARDVRAGLLAEAPALRDQIAGLDAALADWRRREQQAAIEHERALSRLAEAEQEVAALEGAPEAAAGRRSEHAEATQDAGRMHGETVRALRTAEAMDVDAQAARLAAEAALAQAREARARLEERASQARTALANLLADSEAAPAPAGAADLDVSEQAETSLRRRIARLGRERDEMGPVNLRADLESQEAQVRADAIARESGELQEAIARLRGSIGHLNREGRERLLAVFEQVDGHFQALFSRMFGGGRAHLALVGDEDPLLAGLELYAQPPGKKLATLSLLSGGEQALCALSLIFAVFRCNPAPVCVLDEVDAPLDDANVGRFAGLLGDMVAQTGTRFLVVTHHQLTMAHMDRLYGVTMQERGVSRLLSVDFTAASRMAEPG